MRIKSFHIDGFGVYHDTGISSIESGLTVIHAANGAGKTTLRNFLEKMLFGLPPRTGKDEKFDPTSGGAHRGELSFILHDGDEYHIERKFDKRSDSEILTKAGAPSPTPLGQLLGSIPSKVYSNIFAIGLDELTAFKSADEKLISDAIGGIGAAGSGNALKQAREELEKETDELFKARKGSKSKINDALEEIISLRAQIEEAQEKAAKYWRLEEDLADLRTEMQDVEAKRNAYSEINQKLRIIENAWPHFSQMNEAKAELEALIPKIDAFPDNAETRIDQLDKSVDTIDAAIKARSQQIEKLGAEIPNILIDEAPLESAAEIDALTSRIVAQEEAQTRLAKVDDDLAELNASLALILEKLGGWSPERLSQFDADLPQRAEIDKLEQSMLIASQQSAAANRSLELARGALHKLSRELDEARKRHTEQWIAAPPTDETLNRQENARTDAAIAASDAMRIAPQIKAADTKLAEIDADIQKAQKAIAQAGRGQIKGKASTSVGFVVFILSLIFWLLDKQANVYVREVIAFSALFCAISASFFLQIKKRLSTDQYALNQIILEKNTVDTQREQLAAQQRDAQSRLAECGLRLGKEELTPAAIDALRQEIQHARGNRRAFETSLAEIYSLERRVSENSGEIPIDQANMALEALLEAKSCWRQWIKSSGLPENLTPSEARQSLMLAAEGKSLIERIAAEERRKSNEQAPALKFADDALALATRLNIVPIENEPPHDLARRIGARLTEANIKKQAAQNLKSDIELQKRELQSQQAEQSKIKEKIDAILVESHSGSLEDFRAQAGAWKRQTELVKRIELAKQRIAVLSVSDQDLANLLESLENTDILDVRSALDDTSATLNALDKQLKTIGIKIGETISYQSGLENSTEIETLARQIEAKTADAEGMSEEWAKKKIAHWLIEKAKERFNLDRQPSVLKHASQSLAAITSGRYIGISQDLEKNTPDFQLWTASDSKKNVPWNRGLSDQAYLALRYGIIVDYCQRAEPLPVILDDPLVNCDPSHAKGAIEQTVDLATRVQVFYFTCHNTVVEQFRKAAGDCSFWTIRSGKIEQI
jgi:uncharacterized protein YhaN